MARLAIIRWFRGLIPMLIMLFLAVCVGCIVWVSVIGLPDRVIRLVELELARQGVDAEIGNLRVSIVSGVVLQASDVVLHYKLVEYQEPSHIKKLRLDIDMESLWAGEFKVERLEFVDGSMSLPFADSGAKKKRNLALDDFDAVLVFDSNGDLEIREATARLQDMNVRIEGKISTASTGETSWTQEETDQILKQIDEGLDYLDEISWPQDGKPSWNIRISQTEGTPSKVRVNVEMEAPSLEYRAFAVRDVIVEADITENSVWVKRFSCREKMGRGKLDFTARVDLKQRTLALALKSGVPLVSWAEKIADVDIMPLPVEFVGTPSLTLNSRFVFSEDWKSVTDITAMGNVNTGKMIVDGIPFDRCSASFSYGNGKAYVTNFNLATNGKSAQGQVLLVDKDITLEFRNTLSTDTIFKLVHSLTKEKLTLPEGFAIRGNPDFFVKGELSFNKGWNVFPEVKSARVLLKLDDFAAMGVNLDSIVVDAEMHGERIAVNKCLVSHEEKRFSFNGETRDGDVFFSCSSNLPPSLLNEFVRDHFQLPVQLSLPEQIDFTAKGSVSLKKEAEQKLKSLELKLSTDKWQWDKVAFDSLDLECVIDGDMLNYASGRLMRGKRSFEVFASGSLTGELMAIGRTRVRLDVFEKILGLEDDDFFFDRFKYTDDSEFDINYLCSVDLKAPLATYRADAILKANNAYYKGVLVRSAQANVKVAPNIVTLSDCRVSINNDPYIAKRKISKGTGESALTAARVVLDFNKDTALVEGLQASVFPDYALTMFSDSAAEVLAEFYYHSPVRITGGGVFPMGDDFSMMRGSFSFAAGSGQTDYKLLGTTLQVKGMSGDVHIDPIWVKVSNLKGNIWGGGFEGKIDAQIDKGDAINGMISANRLDLAQVGKSYNTKMNTAQVDAGVSFRSSNGKVPSIVGHGTAKLSNGNLVEIPIFGALGKIISKIIPGVGHLTNYNLKQANCEYVIEKGVIRTTSFSAEGSNLALTGKASVDIATTNVDAGMQLRFKGIPSILIDPLYIFAKGLFKVSGKGPLENVDWSLDPFATTK